MLPRIKRTFNVQRVVLALDFRPLVNTTPPYEEIYPFWQLFFVSRGEMEIERAGKRETVKAGEIFFRPPDERSTVHYPEGYELSLSIIDFVATDDAMRAMPVFPLALESKEKRLLSELIREAAAFYKDTPSEVLWQEMTSSALESFLTRLYGRLSGVFPAEAREEEKASTRRQQSDTVERINRLPLGDRHHPRRESQHPNEALPPRNAREHHGALPRLKAPKRHPTHDHKRYDLYRDIGASRLFLGQLLFQVLQGTHRAHPHRVRQGKRTALTPL